MLPVLFKLDFSTPAMRLFALALIAAITAYGAWAGWRGAADRGQAPWRAVPFAAAALIASIIAAVWAFPPMDAALANGVKLAVGLAAAVLTLGGALYGRKLAQDGEDPGATLKYGVGGAVIGFAAFRYGLGGQLGRGFGAPLHTYGLLIATAFIVALAVASREAVRAFPETIRVDGKSVPAGPIMRERVLDLGFWILVAAIVGSRALFIVVNWKDYAGDWSKAFSISGGLVFYGGFIGAVAAALYWCRRNRVGFLRIADVMIPSVALGHAIGRLGCLCAGCCWGGIAKAGSAIAVRFPSQAHLPFGGFGTDSLAYQDQLHDNRWVDSLGHIFDHAVDGAQQISAYAKATGYTLPVYPTQLIESFGELLLFVGLLFLRRYKRFQGQLLATWLIGYSLLRTTNEFFRGDVARGYLFRWPEVDPIILSTSQTISLGIFLAGVALFALYGRKDRAELAPAATP